MDIAAAAMLKRDLVLKWSRVCSAPRNMKLSFLNFFRNDQ